MNQKNKHKIQLPFHIVLLGQIASGKDTQAKMLLDKYMLFPVESGKYWRKLAQSDTPEGDMLRKTTAKGLPAPVALMKKFLVDQITKKPKSKTCIFIGNPRLKPEAQLLDKLLRERKEAYCVIYISLSDTEVLKRSHLRNRSIEDQKYVEKRILWHKKQVGKTVQYFKTKEFYGEINGAHTIEEVHLSVLKKIYTFLQKMKSTQSYT